MSTNRLTLVSTSVESFGGIDKSRPIVISLPEGKNIAIAEGDQGTGKTSWLHSLMYTFGVNFNVKDKDLVNLTDGKLKAGLEFEDGPDKYRVNATKSKFELTKFAEVGGKPYWLPVSEPVATLQRLIGHVGVSPMSLKDKKGADQVREIRKALTVSEDVENEETELKEKLKSATKARTEANSAYNSIKKILEADEMYLNWEQSEEKYKEQKSSEAAAAKLKECEINKNQYAAAITRVETLQQTEKNIQSEIADMEARLILKKQELQTTTESIGKGKDFLEQNKGSVEKYNTALEEYRTIDRYLSQQAAWQTVQQRKKELEEYETLVAKADGLKDDLNNQILELGKKGMPNIEGLEVIATDSIEGKEVGVYLHGKNLAQLSESELWSLFLRIWEASNTRFVLVDNLGVLGSEAVAILNHLAASGCKLFCTLMNRKEADMKITFHEKIN